MKKLVVFILTLVLVVSITATSFAVDCGSHTYIWQKTSVKYVGKYDEEKHCDIHLYIQVCTKCGCTGAQQYIKPSASTVADANPQNHIYSGQATGYHIEGTTTHSFQRKCSVCGAGYGTPKILDCPGGNAHVTCTFP